MATANRTLSISMQGSDVQLLQSQLTQLGLDPPENETGQQFFGAGTLQSVNTFQQNSALPVTGAVDAATASALLSAVVSLGLRKTPARPPTATVTVTGQLLDAATHAPLGALYQVHAFDVLAGAPAADLGYSTTDNQGLFTVGFIVPNPPPAANSGVTAPGTMGPPHSLQLQILDLSGSPLYQITVQVSAPSSNVFTVPVPLPPPPIDTSPTITNALAASHIQIPEDLQAYLTQQNLHTLDDIRRVGGLWNQPNIPGGGTSPAVQALDAHTDLFTLTGDVTKSALLIQAGFTGTQSIAETPRPVFVDKTYAGLGDFGAGQLHSIALANSSILNSIVTGVAAASAQGAVNPGTSSNALFPTQCGCADCQAAVSPMAYLADLMQYIVTYVTLDGKPVTLTTLDDQFFQPFDNLPLDCAAMTTQVRQVRLAVEILRRYIAAIPPTTAQATALAAAELQYCALVYTTLLTQIGTSYDEIRSARMASTATRQSLANRLGFSLSGTRPDSLDALFFDPSAPPGQPLAITEALIEILFGYVDTTRDPLAAGPTPQYQTWQIQFLKATWAQVDQQSPINANGYPVTIDPDLLVAGDFLNPVSSDPAFGLFLARQTWIQTQLTLLQASPQTAAGFQAVIQNTLGIPVSTLVNLGSQDAGGIDISQNLSALNLARDAFLYLQSFNQLISGSLPVMASDWQDIYNILIQVQKNAIYPTWQKQEATQGVVLDGDYFQIYASPSTVPPPPVSLLDWRATLQARNAWLQMLTIRINEENNVISSLQTAVSTTENAALPTLRDSLVLATDASGVTSDEMAEWVSERLLFDAQAGGCQMTTRVAFAMETLQNLLFNLSNGQFNPTGQWTPIGDPHYNDFPALSPVTAVSRAGGLIDIFAVESDGAVYTAEWNGSSSAPSWSDWSAIDNPSTYSFKTKSTVTTISRDVNHLDLFVVGNDGAVYTASLFGFPSAPVWSLWAKISATALADPESVVAAVARDPQHMNVFVIAKTGQVMTSQWDGTVANPVWSPWAGINAFSNFSSPAPLALAARDAQHLTLAGVAKNGLMYAAAWDGTVASPAWSAFNIVGNPATDFFNPSIEVALVARDALHLDLFLIGLNGGVYTNTWDGTKSSPEWGGWALIGILPSDSFPLGAPVTAAARNSSVIEAFAVGKNGGIYNAQRDFSGSAGWSSWQPVGDPSIQTLPKGSEVTAVAVGNNQIQLFAAGSGGNIYTAPYDMTFWNLVDDNFDQKWQWIGSYAMWRSAMFVFLYPENILLPSLLQTATGTFNTLVSNIRLISNLQPSDACQAASTYSQYFQDIASLTLDATCQSQTHIHLPVTQGCENPSPAVYDSVFYQFGRGGVTQTAYWSAFDLQGKAQFRQTFWEPISGLQNVSQILGAVPCGAPGQSHTIYLFAKVISPEGAGGVSYVQYDLEQQQWIPGVISLALPETGPQFDVVVMQSENESAAPHLAFNYNGNIYERTIDAELGGWDSGPWTPMNKYPASDPAFYLWNPPPAFAGVQSLLSMVDNGDGDFFLVVMDHDGDLWVIYYTPGDQFTPSYGIPRALQWHNFGLADLRGAFFQTNTYGMYVCLAGAPNTYLCAVDASYKLVVKKVGMGSWDMASVAPLNGFDPTAYKTNTRLFGYSTSKGPRRCRLKIKPDQSLEESATVQIIPVVSGPFEITDGMSTADLQLRAQQIEEVFDDNPASTVDGSLLQVIAEAYYFVPMQLGLQLEQAGNYTEALSWYRTVYDYTQPEAARLIYYGLELEKYLPSTFNRASDWLLDPLDPHRIAATRAGTYTRFTLLSIVQALLDEADSDYTQYTAETVERARDLYLMALDLLNSSILQQSLGGCDDLIGQLNINFSADQVYLLKRSLQAIKSQVTLSAILGQIQLNFDTKGISHDTFSQAHAMIDQALREKTPPTLKSVLAGKAAFRRRANSLLLSAQSPVQGQDGAPGPGQRGAGLAATLQTAGQLTAADYQNAVSLATGLSPETLAATPLPWLRQPRNASLYNLSGGAASMAAVSGTALESSSLSPKLQILNLMDTNAAVQTIKAIPTPLNLGIDYTFCIPPNPDLQTMQMHAQVNLHQMRNCQNISGMAAPLQPYSAPTDTSTDMPSIGPGGTLQLPGTTSIQPTQYQYETLIARATQLATLAGQMEASMLSALEKKDAESYNLLKANQDVSLTQAQVRLGDLQVTQAQDSVQLAQLQQSRAAIQVDAYSQWLQQPINGLEQQGLNALGNAISLSNVATGLLTGAAAMQAGSGIAQAIVTLGTNTSQLSQALTTTASVFSTQSQVQSLTANQLSQQASYERRAQEWTLAQNLAQQDFAIGQEQVAFAQDGVQVSAQQRQISLIQADQAQSTVNFLSNKFSNVALYDWMSNVLEGVYSYFLQQATAMALLAQNQLAFERQETVPPYIQSDYWQGPVNNQNTDSTAPAQDRRGLTGSERLQEDITQLDQYAFQTNQRKLQLTKNLSLSQLFPLEFEQFRETGVLPFATTLTMFDQDFPGHYLRLIATVRVSVIALIPPVQGIKATLVSNGISRVVIPGNVFSSQIIQRSPEEIALTSPLNATGLFALTPGTTSTDQMLLPFQDSGVAMQWQFLMPKAANFFDYSSVADVQISIDYTALNDANYRTQVIQNMDPAYSADRPYSFVNELADAWFNLNNPDQTATPMTVQWTTSLQDFPPNLTNVTIAQVILYFQMVDGSTTEVPVNHLQFTPTGASAPLGGASQTVNQVISTRRANGAAWLAMIGKTPAGLWELALPNTPAVRNLFVQNQIVDILFDITYSGLTPPWPS